MEDYLYKDLYNFEDKHWWHISKRDICLKLISQYTNGKKLKMLDIGCGTGKNVESFNSQGECWGVDYSRRALQFCRKRKLKNVVQGSAEKLPFPSHSFEVVSLLDVLEHVDEEKTLQEAYRVLKNNGLMIITVPAFSWLWSEWDVVLHHKRRYSLPSLKQILKTHQFEVKKISYLYSFLVIPVFLIRSIKSRFLKYEYASDFKLGSKLVNRIFLWISRLESKLMLTTGLPFGTSLICVAQKKT